MTLFHGEGTAILGLVLVIGGIALELPFKVFSFRPAEAPDASEEASAAFVTLTVEEETAVMRAAKDFWRREGGARKVCTDLFFEELPEAERMPVLPIECRTRTAALPAVSVPVSPFFPSQRACAPQRISADPSEEDSVTFPRDELLKIN